MRTTMLMVAAAMVIAGCKGKAASSGRDAAAAVAVDAARLVVCKEGEAAVPDAEGRKFLDDIGGSLKIELTEEPVKIAPNLENRKATPTATIKSVKLEAHAFERADGDVELRPLTAAELERVVFHGSVLVLQGFGKPVEHVATDCEFTVSDVLRAVEETERKTRGESEWFEGVDVHHVFFEGLSGGGDGVWTIDWGS